MRPFIFCISLAVVSFAAEPPLASPPTFAHPSDATRFFHAVLQLSAAAEAYDITAVEVNGNEELFIARVEGRLTQYREDGGVERTRNGWIPGGKVAEITIRCPWTSGAAVQVVLHCKKHTGEGIFDISVAATAPAEGGFPFPGWKEHRLLMLREDYGIAREHEPYLFFLSDEAGRVHSWEKELRVARFDLDTGSATEVPSQVLYDKRHFDTPQQEKAYATCQAAILADVPAKGRACYLIAYGNPEAGAPQYTSDLTCEQRSDGVFISNEFYDIKLHGPSGQLHGFASKTFGGANRKFGYMPDSGYTLHYNPDVWMKNRSWTHTHGWNPPPKVSIEAGPVAVVTRRWGHLPLSTEVEVQVVYHFFSHTPYMLAESTMDVQQDVVSNALRNEEVVFSPTAEVDHAGWKHLNGEMGYKPVEQEPGMTPGMIQIVEANAPYVCLTREADSLGMASLRLSQHAGSRGDQSPVVAQSFTVIADYGWNFRYWSRSLVYPWGDHLPDQPTVLNAGTYYGEKSAFCLFPLGEGDAAGKLAYVDQLYERLSRPIRIDPQGAGPW